MAEAPGAVVDTVRDPVKWPVNETPAPKSWPVNSVFISLVNTNPATLLGYGTWVAFGAGQVLVGVNAVDPDFTPAGKTGGVKTIKLADHDHHTHSVTSDVVVATAAVQSGAGTTVVTGVTNNAVTSGNETPTLVHKQDVTGSPDLPIVQPYITVYFFKRTA